jgi:adenosylhomocysteine nucleosidase
MTAADSPSEAVRVGLIAPMPSELRPLVKALSMKRVRDDDPTMYVGIAGPKELVATTSGMGTKLAAEAADRLLDLLPFDHVMIVGIAGGMGESKVGDVIAPEVVVDDESGAEFRPAYLDPSTVPRGKLITHDDFDMSEEKTAQLIRDGFLAVDMETAAIAGVCERRNTPWSAVRVISDLVGVTPGDVIDLAHADGSPNIGAGLRYLVRHPARVPGLVKLGRESMAAANSAAATAARALRST